MKKTATLKDNYVAQYEALDRETKCLIEDYTLKGDFAEDCLETLLNITPEKACSIRVLAEAHAKWHHEYMQAKEELEALGYDETKRYQLSAGYFDKQQEGGARR